MRENANAVPFDIVVAADLDDGIGRAGMVPWRLPSDLAFFKRITSETEVPGVRNAVVMGRVTWDSLPPRFRPLPGRLNVVVTRQPDLVIPPEVVRAPSLEDALIAARENGTVERIFVIGGGSIYRRAFDMEGLGSVYLTRVLGHFDCDTTLPPMPSWLGRTELLGEGQDGDLAYRIERWQSVRAPSQ